jgi:hypothetical protein
MPNNGESAQRRNTRVISSSKRATSAFREEAPTTIDKSHRRWNDRHHGVEDEQMRLQHPPYHHAGESEHRIYPNSDNYFSHLVSRERGIEKPSRAPDVWMDSTNAQRTLMLSKVPRTARNPRSNSARRPEGGESGFGLVHKPLVISDISRRELELRSIGVYGNDRTDSTPRMGGRDGEYRSYNASQEEFRALSRGRAPTQHDSYFDAYGIHHDKNSRESRNFLELKSYDDFNGMPASMKLELGARVARKQSEKSVISYQQSGRVLSKRHLSIAQQRPEFEPEESFPELLTAGSLKL